MTEPKFIRVVNEPRHGDDNTENDWILELYVNLVGILEIHVHLHQPSREGSRRNDIVKFHFYTYSIQRL